MHRIAIDIGGTFTDVIGFDEASGELRIAKVPTTADDPSVGFFRGMDALGVPTDQIAFLAHGTTLATNCVLTRTGLKTGLITTRGFRDVLELRRTRRESLFDLNERKPTPLVPRPQRREVTERVNHAGEILTPLDEAEVRQAARAFRGDGVEAVAVCLLFAFANPAHERRVREIVQEEYPGVTEISLSSEISPSYREYERTSTTVLNAYTSGSVSRYVGRIQDTLQERGHRCDLLVMQCTGGLMPAEFARCHPVYTLLSGPAGGAIGGAYLAGQLGFPNALTMDMGGTSCDVTGIAGETPDRRKEFEIGGWAVQLPTIDVNTIGAGGGSVAWVDAGGALHVGPRSAGSHPGPACYGRGGREPTVTDANLVLGRYSPKALLGGGMPMDAEAAYRAIQDYVARPLGLSVEAAAAGMVEVVDSNMMHAVRYVSIERARDPREYVLVAFGGAGPAHAAHVAADLGIPTVVVPRFPGCTSAFGVLVSDVRHDYVQTFHQRADRVDWSVLDDEYARLLAAAATQLARDGVRPADTLLTRVADLRYHGQTHELSLAVGGAGIDAAALAGVLERFHREHEALYGHAFPEEPVEFVNLRVIAVGRTPKPRAAKSASAGGEARAEPSGIRRVYFREPAGFVECPIYERARLGPAARFAGPAIVEQLDSTTVVPPDFLVEVAAGGDMLLRHRATV